MTARDRIVVAVIGVLVALAGFWFLAIGPKRAELAKLNTELTQQEQRRDAALQQARAGEAARAEYGENARVLAEIGKAIPSDDQVGTLVHQLQATARKRDVDFSSVDVSSDSSAGAAAPAGAAGGAAPKPIPLTLTFDGQFYSLERFLSALERYTSTTGADGKVVTRGRLLTLNGVSVTAGEGGLPNLRTTLTATAYTLPKADVPAAAGTATPPASGAPVAPASSSTPAPTTATARGVTP